MGADDNKDKKSRSVTFSDEQDFIPRDIIEKRYYRPFSWQDDVLCQSYGVCHATFLRCTRTIQAFVRANLSHLRYFNEEQTRMLEDLDSLHVIKQGALERVRDYKEEMKREAEMETVLQADMESYDENEGEDENNNNKSDLDTSQHRRQVLLDRVQRQKQQIKELEAENAQVKHASEELKTENKRIAMDTFSLYEFFTQTVADMKGMETEKARLQHIRDQYVNGIQTLQGLLQGLNDDISNEKTKRHKLKKCINGVVKAIDERYTKRKLVDKITKMKLSVAAHQVETEAA